MNLTIDDPRFEFQQLEYKIGQNITLKPVFGVKIQAKQQNKNVSASFKVIGAEFKLETQEIDKLLVYIPKSEKKVRIEAAKPGFITVVKNIDAK